MRIILEYADFYFTSTVLDFGAQSSTSCHILYNVTI
jgi:hypothetical protein